MIYLRHWQIVLCMAAQAFCETERQMMDRERRNDTEDSLKKNKPELFEKWKNSKEAMRHAGLQSIDTKFGRIWFEIGFHGYPLEIIPAGDEEVFRYGHSMKEPEEFSFCTQEEFEEAERMKQKDAHTVRVSPRDIIRSLEGIDLSMDRKPRPRADLDGDFVREE